jgi:hypothetical protein
MNYLLQFIIASNILIFMPFYNFVHRSIEKGILNYDYYTYSLIAPLYFGCFNVLGTFIQNIFKFSDLIKYLLISIFSYSGLMITLHNRNLYNFDKKEMYKHQINVFINYLFIWVIVINLMEKIILNKKIGILERNFIIYFILFYLLTWVFFKLDIY